jgi:hypothetical protein
MLVKRILAFLTSVAVMLVFTSTALADSLGCGHGSTCQQGQAGNGGLPAGTNGVHTGGTGTLPFSGLNLALIAGVAVLLLVSGVLLHRTTRRQQ